MDIGIKIFLLTSIKSQAYKFILSSPYSSDITLWQSYSFLFAVPPLPPRPSPLWFLHNQLLQHYFHIAFIFAFCWLIKTSIIYHVLNFLNPCLQSFWRTSLLFIGKTYHKCVRYHFWDNIGKSFLSLFLFFVFNLVSFCCFCAMLPTSRCW